MRQCKFILFSNFCDHSCCLIFFPSQIYIFVYNINIYIYILYIYIYIFNICIYIYIIWTWLRSSGLVKTKIFPTSFGRGRFQGSLLMITWRQIDFGILCHHLSSKVTWLRCGLGKNKREKAARGSSFSICWVLGSIRTELRFLVSGSRSFLSLLSVRVKYLWSWKYLLVCLWL